MNRDRLRRLAEQIARKRPKTMDGWLDTGHGRELAAAVGKSLAWLITLDDGELPATVRARFEAAAGDDLAGMADRVELGRQALLSPEPPAAVPQPGEDAPLSTWAAFLGCLFVPKEQSHEEWLAELG